MNDRNRNGIVRMNCGVFNILGRLEYNGLYNISFLITNKYSSYIITIYRIYIYVYVYVYIHILHID